MDGAFGDGGLVDRVEADREVMMAGIRPNAWSNYGNGVF